MDDTAGKNAPSGKLDGGAEPAECEIRPVPSRSRGGGRRLSIDGWTPTANDLRPATGAEEGPKNGEKSTGNSPMKLDRMGGMGVFLYFFGCTLTP